MAGKCLTFEGYLQERAVQRGYGATVELSKKAADWMKEAKAADKPSMKLVPGHDLLSELRAAAVKEAIRSSSRCVHFIFSLSSFFSLLTCVINVSTHSDRCFPSCLSMTAEYFFPQTPLKQGL